MPTEAIDLGYLGLAGAACAFLVRDPHTGATALVECGPAACFGRLEAELARRGVGAIDLLVLTHIHLDHAGAAGHLARKFPAMRTLVHPAGARHLVDPSRLVASSRLVHGERYDRHYGDPLPLAAPEPVDDGGIVAFGAGRFRAIATPGHARHHHAWSLEGKGEGVLFTGDAAGMLVPESGFVSVPLPPPDLDPGAWRGSIARMEREAVRGPTTLGLTHGGLVADAAAHLARFRARFEAELAAFAGLAAEVAAGAIDEPEAIRRAGAWLEPQAIAAGVTPERRAAFLGPAYRAMNLAGCLHELRRGRAIP